MYSSLAAGLIQIMKRELTCPSIRKALADTKGLRVRTQASFTRYRVGTLSEQSATMSYMKTQSQGAKWMGFALYRSVEKFKIHFSIAVHEWILLNELYGVLSGELKVIRNTLNRGVQPGRDHKPSTLSCSHLSLFCEVRWYLLMAWAADRALGWPWVSSEWSTCRCRLLSSTTS